jgi:hypothetical protein
LAIIAAVGFVLAIVCFGAAGLVGGASWKAAGHDWPKRWIEHLPGVTISSDDEDDDTHGAGGPAVTRDFAWGGGHDLTIDAPADVDYTQGPVAKITVTGPKSELDHLVVKDGRIGFSGWSVNAGPLKVVMTAPDVTHFETDGSQTLTINGYKQDQLAIDLEGSGDVVAKGWARETSLTLAGSGDGDLGGLTGDAVKVEIDGSGDATIAPKLSADVHVSGSGGVVLLTHPATVNSDITGSGSLHQPAPDKSGAAA